MLENLGLVVYLRPTHAKVANQEALQEAMTTHNTQGRAPAFAGQAHAAVAHVLDQSLAGETLHHAGYRCRRNAQLLGHLGG